MTNDDINIGGKHKDDINAAWATVRAEDEVDGNIAVDGLKRGNRFAPTHRPSIRRGPPP